MKKVFYLLIFAAILFTNCSKKDSNNVGPINEDPVVEEPDQKVVWLKENVVEISNILPANEDFSDLQGLKQAIGNSRVVLLGEQSHSDGNTFLAKTRLIKFLHQEMGFDVILFESGLYECNKANELLKQGESIDNSIKNAVFGIWARSLQCQDVFNYIKNNIDQIDFGGIDNQFTGNFSNDFLSDLENYLQSINLTFDTIQKWDDAKIIITNLISGVYNEGAPPEEANKNNFKSTIEQLIADLENTEGLKSTSDNEFWIQDLKSVLNLSNFKWGQYGYETGQIIPAEIRSMRDVQMGQNLVWQANKNYPNRKIIVWAATYHNIRNLSKLKNPLTQAVNPSQAEMTTMGEVSYNSLGSDIYSIGFTAYKGTYGFKGTYDVTTLTTPPDGSLEDLFYKTEMINMFLDFRTKSQTSGGNWLKQDLLSRPLGYQYDLANWSEILDAMVYTRFMTPSEMIN